MNTKQEILFIGLVLLIFFTFVGTVAATDIYVHDENTLEADTGSVTIISAPEWLPRDMGLSYYSPGVEIAYIGLKNKTYTLKVWLLERDTGRWYCASTQICENTSTIDNTGGNNSSGIRRIPQKFDVYDYSTFDWVVRLYDGTNEVDWAERYAIGTDNRPPKLSLIGDQEVIQYELLEFKIYGTDPVGDRLTYQAANLPSGASFDPANRTFSWIPTTVGNYSNIRFRVTDNGEGDLYDSEYITINVRPPPPPLVQKGVCYGPFRDGQNPHWGPYPSETDIREDMPLLKNMSEAIRTYGVTKGLEKIVPIANEFDLNVSPGAWLCGEQECGHKYTESNEEEITNLTRLAQNYDVDSVIVGSEVILRYENGWDNLTKAELIDYITRVKENVSVPVTTGEPWHIWDKHSDLVDSVDYILLYVHPYWEGQPIENGANYVFGRYEQIHNKYPQKEVVLGEFGWPTEGLPNGEANPSVENQERFMNDFLKLANEKEIGFYYFEAFDEKWKVDEPNGVGPHWGFYHSNRTAKHSIDSVSTLPIHNLNTSEDFSKIQAAIDDRDTETAHIIEVDPGTYNENVKVYKSLKFRSTSGNPDDTIVHALKSTDHVFNVTANYVNITGFTIKGATDDQKVGIYLYNVEHCNISDNNASDNRHGILLKTSRNNTLTNNTVSNNHHGIYLVEECNNNLIYNNYFKNMNNAYDDGKNIWNISKIEGTNIVGGDWLGGNYWSDYEGNDTDGDGLSDTLLPYNSSGNITNGGDWLPLVEPYHRWDINEDGITNYLDAAHIGVHYGEVTTEPYPRYDINEDGVVNYLDAAYIGIHYGEVTP